MRAWLVGMTESRSAVALMRYRELAVKTGEPTEGIIYQHKAFSLL